MKIYIVGHISPDLDAISSAVEYAEFLAKLGRYKETQIIPTIPGKPNHETETIFKKFDVAMPQLLDNIDVTPEDAFILVDHNEQSQRHPKVKTDQIIEVVDHHKINVSFITPVRIDVKPLGSTSTVVYDHFEMYGLKPSKQVASLILAAIISDTLGLKSPTTTGTDMDFSDKIAKEFNLNYDELLFEIFKAKSDISGLSAYQLVNKDVKVYDFSDKKVFIGLIETVEPEKILNEPSEIVKALEQVKTEQKVDQAYLFVTDILKLNSHAIYATDAEKCVLEKAFTGIGHSHVINVGPKVSRKKDLAPAIEMALR